MHNKSQNQKVCVLRCIQNTIYIVTINIICLLIIIVTIIICYGFPCLLVYRQYSYIEK